AKKAITYFEKALAVRQADAGILHNLALAHGNDGELKKAEEYYQRALEINPLRTDIWRDFLRITRLDEKSPAWKQLKELESSAEKLPPLPRSQLFFALGKAYDDQGEHDKAFEYYDQGNAIKHALIKPDVSQQLKTIEAIIEIFSEEFIKENSGKGIETELPVFIVGMPRSGSTLIEQIVASHSAAHAGGESTILPFILDDIQEDKPFPGFLQDTNDKVFSNIGQAYLDQIKPLADKAARFTDKQLANFLHVGLIRLIFPRARIIHCMRHPLDSCVSAYFTDFTHSHWYSTKLEDLAGLYRGYEKIMAHWRKTLPDAMLEIRYEDVVHNLRDAAQKVIDYCGLPWEESCVEFHKTRRGVRTASQAQVRREIYTSSVNRWRHYEKHLGPLRAALDLDENGDPRPATVR
ncbi:MAG: sulfotransferase, partial [Gammaproteobacteria bacterium]|nr:sulfotransferase [Gammaproteobacteria bacterium]